MSWWDDYPGRLEKEIAELQAVGFLPDKDQEAFGRGIGVIHIQLRIFGQVKDAQLIYPELYPYFRPFVYCLGLGDGLRHYNLFSGEICLLRRGTSEWQPSWTAAKHISMMLPEWEKAAVRAFDESRLVTEDHQAEPRSANFPPHNDQIFLMNSSDPLPEEVCGGTLKILLSDQLVNISPAKPLRAFVLSACKNDKSPLTGCLIDGAMKNYAHANCGHKENINWSRINKIPSSSSGESLFRSINEIAPDVYRGVESEIKRGRGGIHGLCFKEERPGGGLRDAWLFLAYKAEFSRHRGQIKIDNAHVWLITTEQIGEDDFFQRVPELRSLREKTVALIGLGCVGAPSALEFARAGVGELRLWDGDYVSAGTICRWPEGMSAITIGKAKRLSAYVRNNYPYTRIGINHYPGSRGDDFAATLGVFNNGYDQIDGLNKFFEGADLIYDATAELGINHLLADMAKRKGVPYIAVSSRPGGWGGSVVRILPRTENGCYLCFLKALQDGDISQPSYDPEGDKLQPAGCGDLTFKAASFDVQEISLAGVRMAMSILCEGRDSGYPPIQEDVGILHLREDGKSIFPRWEAFKLPKYENCGNPWCGC